MAETDAGAAAGDVDEYRAAREEFRRSLDAYFEVAPEERRKAAAATGGVQGAVTVATMSSQVRALRDAGRRLLGSSTAKAAAGAAGRAVAGETAAAAARVAAEGASAAGRIGAEVATLATKSALSAARVAGRVGVREAAKATKGIPYVGEALGFIMGAGLPCASAGVTASGIEGAGAVAGGACGAQTALVALETMGSTAATIAMFAADMVSLAGGVWDMLDPRYEGLNPVVLQLYTESLLAMAAEVDVAPEDMYDVTQHPALALLSSRLMLAARLKAAATESVEALEAGAEARLIAAYTPALLAAAALVVAVVAWDATP